MSTTLPTGQMDSERIREICSHLDRAGNWLATAGARVPIGDVLLDQIEDIGAHVLRLQAAIRERDPSAAPLQSSFDEP